MTAVPFPTAVVGTYLTTSAASVACATYAGFFALINVSYNLLWWVVFRQKVNYYALEPHLPRSMLVSLLGLPCYLLAMVVALESRTDSGNTLGGLGNYAPLMGERAAEPLPIL